MVAVKAKLKLVEAAVQMHEQEAQEAGELGFVARAMVQATMPHSRPGSDRFVRKNGNYRLVMQAMREGVSLPYGSIPRLLIAWIVTEAARTKSPVLKLGDSLSGFMADLGMVPTGGQWGSITRLSDQIERLFSCSVGIYYSSDEGVHGKQMFIADKFTLWWNHKSPIERTLFDSTIKLSQQFFDEITSNPIPVDMRALKALKKSPLALDIYMWMTYRLSYLKKPTCIPWGGLQGQLGSGYPGTTRGRADFKRRFNAAMLKVQCVMPGLKLFDNKKGLMVYPSPPHIRAK